MKFGIKMDYYVIAVDPSVTNNINFSWINFKECKWLDLTQPISLKPHKAIDISFNGKSVDLPDFVYVGRLTIISETLRDIIEANQEDVEFIPVNMITRDQTVTMYVLHFLFSIDCIDKNESDYDLLARIFIQNIRKLALRKNLINAEIFTPEDTGLILISENLKKLIKENCHGLRFFHSNEYNQDLLGQF